MVSLQHHTFRNPPSLSTSHSTSLNFFTMNTTTTELTVEQAKAQVLARLKPRYTLWYADRNDYFHDAKTIAKLYETGGNSFWDDCDWYGDARYDMARQELDEEMTDEEDRVLAGTEEYCELREDIEARDDSNPLTDMLKNTPSQWMLTPIGLSLDSPLGEESASAIREIKGKLGIAIGDERYDAKLEELVENATYGGRVVVLYYDDVDQLILDKDEIKTLRFKNPNVCLRDSWNGSGYDVKLEGLEIELPHAHDEEAGRGGVFFDKTDGIYSYAVDVCGLVSSYYEGTLDFGYAKPQ